MAAHRLDMPFRRLGLHETDLEMIDQGQKPKVPMAPTLSGITAERVFKHCLTILDLRVDREVGLDSQMHAVLPEDLRTKSAEGSDVGSVFRSRHEGGDAGRHFVRRLVGERQGKDTETPTRGRIQQAGDPAREHPGLAGTGSCEHEQSAIVPIDRSALDVGQFDGRRSQLTVRHVSPAVR